MTSSRASSAASAGVTPSRSVSQNSSTNSNTSGGAGGGVSGSAGGGVGSSGSGMGSSSVTHSYKFKRIYSMALKLIRDNAPAATTTATSARSSSAVMIDDDDSVMMLPSSVSRASPSVSACMSPFNQTDVLMNVDMATAAAALRYDYDSSSSLPTRGGGAPTDIDDLSARLARVKSLRKIATATTTQTQTVNYSNMISSRLTPEMAARRIQAAFRFVLNNKV